MVRRRRGGGERARAAAARHRLSVERAGRKRADAPPAGDRSSGDRGQPALVPDRAPVGRDREAARRLRLERGGQRRGPVPRARPRGGARSVGRQCALARRCPALPGSRGSRGDRGVGEVRPGGGPAFQGSRPVLADRADAERRGDLGSGRFREVVRVSPEEVRGAGEGRAEGGRDRRGRPGGTRRPLAGTPVRRGGRPLRRRHLLRARPEARAGRPDPRRRRRGAGARRRAFDLGRGARPRGGRRGIRAEHPPSRPVGVRRRRRGRLRGHAPDGDRRPRGRGLPGAPALRARAGIGPRSGRRPDHAARCLRARRRAAS